MLRVTGYRGCTGAKVEELAPVCRKWKVSGGGGGRCRRKCPEQKLEDFTGGRDTQTWGI